MNGSATTTALLAFLAGGLTGAGLALLFAPRSGRHTRALIDQKVRRHVDRAREGTERVIAKGQAIARDASEYLDKQATNLETQKNRVLSAVEVGREAYRDGEPKM
jgi:gas vesicle protein